jgi:3'-phosphoadenosine 5'-phosphosulfate sulfotransferase (PAPS reductase)/FAD synthetase
MPTDEVQWLREQGWRMDALTAPRSTPTEQIDLGSYDHVEVAFSGGKDSLAMLLHLFDLGVDRKRITLLHHLVDGREGRRLMDYPVTEDYCRRIAAAFGLPILFSWREGGMEREARRENQPTAPMCLEQGDGSVVRVGGNGPLGTRRKFPQQSASLATRWCSSSLKIAPCDAYLANTPKFRNARTLVTTGERAEESAARACYAVQETHRADARRSTKTARHVDHWRPVHSWSEEKVWDIIRRYKVCPHPAYWLGTSRCSCAYCIFADKDQLATMRVVDPQGFNAVADTEREFRVTIARNRKSIGEIADSGNAHPNAFGRWAAIAMATEFTEPVFMDHWHLPPGAFRNSAGPT